MAWTIEFTKQALKQLSKLDKPIQIKISKFLLKLSKVKNPRTSGTALKGDLYLFWRYRIGDYRVICDLSDNKMVVTVVKVSHRKEIYK